MMSHFGRKPVSGGRPARDSRVSMRAALRGGFFAHEAIIVDSFVELDVLRVRKIEVVMMVYRRKVVRVSLGEKITMRAIHPR